MSESLVVFDGHSMMHRCFHAGKRQLDLAGHEVGAVLTLLDQLVRLLGKMRARHLVMTFDPGGPLFRHQLAPDYKSTRKPTVRVNSLIEGGVSTFDQGPGRDGRGGRCSAAPGP